MVLRVDQEYLVADTYQVRIARDLHQSLLFVVEDVDIVGVDSQRLVEGFQSLVVHIKLLLNHTKLVPDDFVPPIDIRGPGEVLQRLLSHTLLVQDPAEVVQAVDVVGVNLEGGVESVGRLLALARRVKRSRHAYPQILVLWLDVDSRLECAHGLVVSLQLAQSGAFLFDQIKVVGRVREHLVKMADAQRVDCEGTLVALDSTDEIPNGILCLPER